MSDADERPQDAEAPPESPSDDTPGRPRRFKPRPDVEMPSGYRASRRGSKSTRQARRAMREQSILRVWDKTRKTTTNLAWLLGMLLATAACLALLLWGGAWVVNSVVRWNARRAVVDDPSIQRTERARENLLIIGVDKGKAAGFLATRFDEQTQQVFGVAIPDGAFIEVPGQGFERLGDSLVAGPDISTDAVSNYLGVPFERYVTVPSAAYQQAVQKQSLSRVLDRVSETNVDQGERARLDAAFKAVPSKNVALVPLPVKPIKLGNQTYFEPQRDEIADLLKTWWGVDLSDQSEVTKVIVYNGAGVPGIAGQAAQLLIRSGYRVVDTKNADKFNYKTTYIVVQRGDKSVGGAIRKVLGVGKIELKPSEQEVASVIIIIGKDFKPAKSK